MSLFSNVLTQEDIEYLKNLPEVLEAKARLSSSEVQYFRITLNETIRSALINKLGLNLSNVTHVPMRWIKGDTAPHIDRGASKFENTYLVYINDSEGNFILEDTSYPITENTGFVFSEGLTHKTQGTGSIPRLLLGPMNEFAQSVGSAGITYVDANGVYIANNYDNYIVGVTSNGTIESYGKWRILSAGDSNGSILFSQFVLNNGDNLSLIFPNSVGGLYVTLQPAINIYYYANPVDANLKTNPIAFNDADYLAGTVTTGAIDASDYWQDVFGGTYGNGYNLEYSYTQSYNFQISFHLYSISYDRTGYPYILYFNSYSDANSNEYPIGRNDTNSILGTVTDGSAGSHTRWKITSFGQTTRPIPSTIFNNNYNLQILYPDTARVYPVAKIYYYLNEDEAANNESGYFAENNQDYILGNVSHGSIGLYTRWKIAYKENFQGTLPSTIFNNGSNLGLNYTGYINVYLAPVYIYYYANYDDATADVNPIALNSENYLLGTITSGSIEGGGIEPYKYWVVEYNGDSAVGTGVVFGNTYNLGEIASGIIRVYPYTNAFATILYYETYTDASNLGMNAIANNFNDSVVGNLNGFGSIGSYTKWKIAAVYNNLTNTITPGSSTVFSNGDDIGLIPPSIPSVYPAPAIYYYANYDDANINVNAIATNHENFVLGTVTSGSIGSYKNWQVAYNSDAVGTGTVFGNTYNLGEITTGILRVYAYTNLLDTILYYETYTDASNLGNPIAMNINDFTLGTVNGFGSIGSYTKWKIAIIFNTFNLNVIAGTSTVFSNGADLGLIAPNIVTVYPAPAIYYYDNQSDANANLNAIATNHENFVLGTVTSGSIGSYKNWQVAYNSDAVGVGAIFGNTYNLGEITTGILRVYPYTGSSLNILYYDNYNDAINVIGNGNFIAVNQQDSVLGTITEGSLGTYTRWKIAVVINDFNGNRTLGPSKVFNNGRDIDVILPSTAFVYPFTGPVVFIYYYENYNNAIANINSIGSNDEDFILGTVTSGNIDSYTSWQVAYSDGFEGTLPLTAFSNGSDLGVTFTGYVNVYPAVFIYYYANYDDAVANINSIARNAQDFILGTVTSGSIESYTQWRIVYEDGFENPLASTIFSNGENLELSVTGNVKVYPAYTEVHQAFRFFEGTGSISRDVYVSDEVLDNESLDSANSINYNNNNIANSANTHYTNAYNLDKSCKDAAYSAFLTTEASQIRLDKLNTSTIVAQLGNSYPYINPMNPIYPNTMSTMVANFKQNAETDVNNASANIETYIINTQNLLNNAIVKSSSITTNLILVAAIDTFTKSVIQMVSFPLLEISGKETPVTQNIPSIILTCAINVCNNARLFLNALIYNNSGVNLSLFGSLANNYANTLDSIANSNNLNKYFIDKIQNNLITSITSTVRNGRLVTIPTNNPYWIANKGLSAAAEAAAANARAVGALIVAASTTQSAAADAAAAAVIAAADAAAAISPVEATRLARNANTSAQNARSVSNAMADVIAAFNNTIELQPFIGDTILNSLSSVTKMINIINTITSNTSVNTAVAITRRASNTIIGKLHLIAEKEAASLEAATDANSILELLNTAYNLTVTTTDLTSIKNKQWALNAASAKASEVSDKLKNKALLASNTAHIRVTPEKIAVMTNTANTLGMLAMNQASRIDRTSREVYNLPPTAYSGFNAEIRAKTFNPVRPTLTELVYKNRIQPLRLDSIGTILDNNIKVAQNVQKIHDKSAFSFRQQ